MTSLDLAPAVAAMILEHPSGDMTDGLFEALQHPWPVMALPVFKRGVSIALELAAADGRLPEDVE